METYTSKTFENMRKGTIAYKNVILRLKSIMNNPRLHIKFNTKTTRHI